MFNSFKLKKPWKAIGVIVNETVIWPPEIEFSTTGGHVLNSWKGAPKDNKELYSGKIYLQDAITNSISLYISCEGERRSDVLEPLVPANDSHTFTGSFLVFY